MIGNVAVYRFTSDASVVDAARTNPDDRRAKSSCPLVGRS